jgi:hypothetical protein
MTEKDIERIALSTNAPYIVNREEKIFLMDAAVLKDFVKKVSDAHKEELTRD